MFTGIVREKGRIIKVVRSGQAYRLVIKADIVGRSMDMGESIAVNGICLSLVKKTECLFFDVVHNTYKSTNLKRLRPGSIVNLEEALKAGDDLSGHIVSGHVDAERKILKNQKVDDGWILDIETLISDKGFITPKGSITIDGVSLTIGDVRRKHIRIFVIPHTLDNTTIPARKPGDFVNVEFDVMAKYVNNTKSVITNDFLSQRGFI